MLPLAAGTTTSPSMIAELALMCHASSGDLLEAFGPVVPAAGEYGDGFVGEMHLDAIAVKLDFMDPAFA
ncbi:hypothetical protein ABID62_002799 [Bradyrhizobium sp. S3.9.1]